LASASFSFSFKCDSGEPRPFSLPPSPAERFRAEYGSYSLESRRLGRFLTVLGPPLPQAICSPADGILIQIQVHIPFSPSQDAEIPLLANNTNASSLRGYAPGIVQLRCAGSYDPSLVKSK